MAWYSWPFNRSTSAEPIVKAPPSGAGVGGFQPAVTPPAETKPAGADGVSIIGGFVVSRERDPKLAGVQKWITYDNQTLNIAIIASAVNVWTQLAGSARWTVEPNKRGGKDAEKAADIVTQGLLEAQLSTPWRQVVRRQVMKKFRGFAMHEVVLRRRSDDMIVVGDIQDRPQWTIWRWNRPDPQAGWVGVEQQTEIHGTWYIPRERLFYSVENTLSSSPEGIGLLRQTAEPARVFEIYRRFEGIGLQTDLRGIPLALAPLQEIVQAAKAEGAATPAQINAFVRAATNDLVTFLAAHNKDERQGILLDSAMFKDIQGNPTGGRQWGFDLVKGASSSLPDVNTAIGRETRDIARIMCAEWLLLGGEDSGGAYSMHEDKTAMFGLCVNSALEDVADDATRDIATRLVAMNGLDPETCTPRLVPEPIATGAVKDACQSLMAMTQAALDPRDKAINVLRGRMSLPPAPEVDESMLILPHGDTVTQLGPDGKQVAVPPAGTQAKKPTPGEGDGEAGNTNARPEAAEKPTKVGKRNAHGRSAAVVKFDPDQPRDDHGRFGTGSGAPMAERSAPGGDLHERATASLQDRAFVTQHAARLERAGDEARSNFPGREASDDAHHAVQANGHMEAMRIHHEQDVIGDNPHLQRIADRAREAATKFRREDSETAHASVLNELDRMHRAATLLHQGDLDAKSRGFADANAERAHHQAIADAGSQSRGFANQDAEEAHKEAESARADRAEEDKAIAAGHVSAEPREIGDRYEAAINEHRRAAETHVDTLDRANHEAADALAALHEYSHEDHEGFALERATPSLVEAFHESQTGLHEALGRDEHDGYERASIQRDFPAEHGEVDLAAGDRYQPDGSDHGGIEYVPHPDHVENLTDEGYAHQLAAHEAFAARAEVAHREAVETRRVEFQRRATAAQDALERLHEHQVAAHEQLKASSRAADKAQSDAEKALDKVDLEKLVREHAFERDAHGDIVDDRARADYERATAAAETMAEHAQHRIEDRRFDASEALGSLKESTRGTRDAIRELAKITGRAAKLPAKVKAKKSANCRDETQKLTTPGASLRSLVGRKGAGVETARLVQDGLVAYVGVAKFDADQPRANDGKWTSDGGGGGSGGGGSAERRATIAGTPTDSDGGFHPDVQRAIREQTVSELKQFGIHPSKAGESGDKRNVVTVLSDAKLAGAGATMSQSTGEMKISQTFADAYRRFYGQDPGDIAGQLDGVRFATLYAQDHPGRGAAMAAFAHRVVVHEQIHASGPQLGYFKYGVALEEVATEMSARHVHAAALGVDSRDVRGSYNQIIYRNVLGVQKATGVDARTAYGALEHAALSWKRQPDNGHEHTPEVALKFMAEHALKHVGIRDDHKTTELSDHMVQAWKDEVKAGRM